MYIAPVLPKYHPTYCQRSVYCPEHMCGCYCQLMVLAQLSTRLVVVYPGRSAPMYSATDAHEILSGYIVAHRTLVVYLTKLNPLSLRY